MPLPELQGPVAGDRRGASRADRRSRRPRSTTRRASSPTSSRAATRRGRPRGRHRALRALVDVRRGAGPATRSSRRSRCASRSSASSRVWSSPPTATASTTTAIQVVAVESGAWSARAACSCEGEVGRLGRMAVEAPRARPRASERRYWPPPSASARDAGARLMRLHAQRYVEDLYTACRLHAPTASRSSRRASRTCRWRSRLPELRHRPAVRAADDRGRRARRAARAASSRSSRARRSTPRGDPFLEGHEDRTPPEVLRAAPGRRRAGLAGLARARGAEPLSRARRRRTATPPPPTRSPRDAAAGPVLLAPGGRRARGDRQHAARRVGSLAELDAEQLETAMGVWRERMRAHAEARSTCT